MAKAAYQSIGHKDSNDCGLSDSPGLDGGGYGILLSVFRLLRSLVILLPMLCHQEGLAAMPVGKPIQPSFWNLRNCQSIEYPRLALSAQVTGAVLIEIQVNENGFLRSAHLRQGHPWLTEAAIQNLRPALLCAERIPASSWTGSNLLCMSSRLPEFAEAPVASARPEQPSPHQQLFLFEERRFRHCL